MSQRIMNRRFWERLMEDRWVVLTPDLREVEYEPEDHSFDACVRYLREQQNNPSCPNCED